MWNYRRNLERDLERWTRAGWVTPSGAAEIRKDLARAPGIGLAGVLGILASVLLAFAVFSFVGANWDEIPRLARMVLLFGLMGLGYFIAGVLETWGKPALGDAALLFAVSVFGASIALISQMYHIDGHAPDGVMLWWLGALLAGVVLRSNPVLALAMVLVCVWSGMEMAARNRVFWPFLIGWTAVTAAFSWQRWRPGAHLAALALTYFAICLGFFLDNGHAHHIVAGLGLAGVALALAHERSGFDSAALAPPALTYAAGIAFAGLFALQFVENPTRGTLMMLAGLTLVLLLAAIWYALQTRNRGLLWFAYVAFSIETFAIYYNLAGTMLSTSLFFLVAGLIVAALAFMAWLLHERGRRLEAAA